jgi:hypothetical protein
MKKYWHEERYRRYNRKKSRKGLSKNYQKKYNPNKTKVPIYLDRRVETKFADPVVAPAQLCLLEQTIDTLKFFNSLRSEENINKRKGVSYISLDLKAVRSTDYSTVCVLLAVLADLKSKSIYTHASLPLDKQCYQKMIDSGLLNGMLDDNGKPYPKSTQSEYLTFERGAKMLSKKDNIRITEAVCHAVKHLTGEDKVNKNLRRIIIEICGNSIEWSQATQKQWFLGLKYEENRVIFTVTDVGRGVLASLHRRMKLKLIDFAEFKDEIDILNGAFEKKYGSASKKINRNKGLPSVKGGFDKGLLLDLKVLTNKVILHFENSERSELLDRQSEFKGTFYRWVITKKSLNSAA